MRKFLWFLMGCFVGALFALFALRQEFRRDQTPSTLPMVPVCDSLPERGPDNIVSIRTSRIASHPGIVCVRVYSSTQKVGNYTQETLRLERSRMGLVWLPYFGMSDILALGAPKFLVLYPLLPGTHRDFYLPSRRAPASAGTYRVRLRYRLDSEGEEHTVYSEEFVLP